MDDELKKLIKDAEGYFVRQEQQKYAAILIQLAYTMGEKNQLIEMSKPTKEAA